MNLEKKELMKERQKHIATLYRNKALLKINVLILSFGLALSYIGKEVIGKPLLWAGIGIFIYTMVSNYTARAALKKL